jgi:hypothetical protein
VLSALKQEVVLLELDADSIFVEDCHSGFELAIIDAVVVCGSEIGYRL